MAPFSAEKIQNTPKLRHALLYRRQILHALCQFMPGEFRAGVGHGSKAAHVESVIGDAVEIQGLSQLHLKSAWMIDDSTLSKVIGHIR